MSRGNREGNNALIQDANNSYCVTSLDGEEVMRWDIPLDIIQEAKRLKLVDDSELIENIDKALRWGNHELAAHFIEIDIKKNKVQ